MKKLIHSILLITAGAILSFNVSAQRDTTIFKQVTFSPGPDDSASGSTFITYGCNPGSMFNNAENTPVTNPVDEITAAAWTYGSGGCDSGVTRFYQKFPDMANLPSTAVIDSAHLVLKGKTSPFLTITVGNSYYPGSPYNNYGTNELYIARVLGSWTSNTITRNNAPGHSMVNRVTVPPSTTQGGYDVNLDVTNLVQDMIDSSTVFGFVGMLQTENWYRSMIFFNSYSGTAANRPKLEVYYHYDSALSIKEVNAAGLALINVYPNPAQSTINIKYSAQSQLELSYTISDVQGRVVSNGNNVVTPGGGNIAVDIHSLTKGLYIIRLSEGTTTYTKRFTKL